MTDQDPVAAAKHGALAPTFTPPSGAVQGWVDRDVVRATGIPYATALRFQRPIPAPDRDDLFLAQSWSPACPQNMSPRTAELLGAGLGELGFDEHCQNLSVTLPAGTRPDARLPVMVWLHGGANITGAGDAPVLDPYLLVSEQRAVVVTVTYRLGLFGYLDGDGRPANLGLLDQLEAFRWVRRNIAAFGGDPDNVTAFGQSAGGDAIVHLLATGQRLFDRAIVQSAPLGIRTGRGPMTAAMRRTARNLRPDSPVETVLRLQRSVLASAIRFGLRAGMAFGVEYGEAPLPAEADLDVAWDGAVDVPLLIGSNTDETAYFLAGLAPVRVIRAIPVVGRRLVTALIRASTRAVYGTATDQFAARHADAGGATYRYTISFRAPGNPYGSPHTIDLSLLFGTQAITRGAAILAGATWEQIDRAGRAVRQLWVDFARGTALPLVVAIPDVLTARQVAVTTSDPTAPASDSTPTSSPNQK